MACIRKYSERNSRRFDGHAYGGKFLQFPRFLPNDNEVLRLVKHLNSCRTLSNVYLVNEIAEYVELTHFRRLVYWRLEGIHVTSGLSHPSFGRVFPDSIVWSNSESATVTRILTHARMQFFLFGKHAKALNTHRRARLSNCQNFKPIRL